MNVIEFAEKRLQEEIHQNDLGADNGHLLAYWAAYLDGARAQKKDAAAAIEALQAEIRETMQKCAECCEADGPERGEWELIDEAEPMRWGCSRCKYLSWETSSYCPRCGAKMTEVQDGQE